MTQDVEMKDHTAPSNSVSSSAPSTLHRKYRLRILYSHCFKFYAMFNNRVLVGTKKKILNLNLTYLIIWDKHLKMFSTVLDVIFFTELNVIFFPQLQTED